MNHNMFYNPTTTDLNAFRKAAANNKDGQITIHFHKHDESCDIYKHELYVNGEQIDERTGLKLGD